MGLRVWFFDVLSYLSLSLSFSVCLSASFVSCFASMDSLSLYLYRSVYWTLKSVCSLFKVRMFENEKRDWGTFFTIYSATYWKTFAWREKEREWVFVSARLIFYDRRTKQVLLVQTAEKKYLKIAQSIRANSTSKVKMRYPNQESWFVSEFGRKRWPHTYLLSVGVKRWDPLDPLS